MARKYTRAQAEEDAREILEEVLFRRRYPVQTLEDMTEALYQLVSKHQNKGSKKSNNCATVRRVETQNRGDTQMRIMLIVLFSLLFSTSAFAQSNCAPRAVVLERLTEQYGETPQMSGLSSAGLFEVFASKQTGSWTILRTLPDGLTCIMAAGGNFEDLEDKNPGQAT